jgi:hypothetical protein
MAARGFVSGLEKIAKKDDRSPIKRSIVGGLIGSMAGAATGTAHAKIVGANALESRKLDKKHIPAGLALGLLAGYLSSKRDK